jgi:hypothetical protein
MGINVFIPRKESAITEISGGRYAATGRSSRVNDILDLQESAYVVPFLMASGGVVGRSVVGPGFDVVQADAEVEGSKAKRNKILKFFNYVPEDRTNIKDEFGPLAKLYTTALMYRMFGHAAWQLLRDENNRALGFDLVPGVIKPNVDIDGSFLRPAYTQYLRQGKAQVKEEFNDPREIVYFCVPDFGAGIWLADSLALSDYSLPGEIYAARAYKSLHENRNAPHSGFWFTSSEIDDDTFDSFVAMVRRRYTGSENYGKNPIVMKGEGGYTPISVPKDEAPYIEGREMTRKEMSAVSGVPGAKYGVGLENVGAGSLEELRREFYESTMRPIMSLIEEVVYRQICVRLFKAPEWKFKFNRPDFTTAVEDASIELRRIQWGQWSPNDARLSRGELPREGGDYYLVPKNMDVVGPDGVPGRPDNEEVDDDQGDMAPAEEDPVPDTQPPEKPDSIIDAVDELRKWRKFELRVARGQRNKRDFVAENLPEPLYIFVLEALKDCKGNVRAIKFLFDDLIMEIESFSGA